MTIAVGTFFEGRAAGRPRRRAVLRALLRSPRELRWLPTWSATMATGWSALDARVPWLTFAATAWLEAWLPDGARVFEFGAGGSTLFFADRGAEVRSVEHDEAFARRVEAALGEVPAEVVLAPPRELRAPRPYGLESYTSVHPGFEQLDFEGYARTVRSERDGSLDVVLVDGRARASCVFEALPKLKPDGVLVFDNAERPAYQVAVRALLDRGLEERAFEGLGPGSPYPWRTSVFRRTEGADPTWVEPSGTAASSRLRG